VRSHLKGGTLYNRGRIIGSSPELLKCLEFATHVSLSDASVLLTGDTGTGKELVARVIHENSERSHHDFVVVDCAALPATLVESVLFGHEKGAFTGADKPQDGLILQAHKGTLFLDEAGELPLAIQNTFVYDGERKGSDRKAFQGR
jgi:two-component system NtrC family response regulator